MMTMSRFEGGHQHLLDISKKGFAIDRPINDAGCVDPVGAERGKEGEGSPTPMRNLRHQPCTAGATAMGARHIGLSPGLIDEDDAGRIELALVLLPARPPPCDVRAVLLAGVQAFF